ncbi:hypothetical protein [Bacillus sp. AFS017336]|uniref:hypothetical protein n=1 Tax=Bacillus sp. AFS017336 TaxID=2033489 RepID=UPI000BEF5805|nr:hypothetical protein [Bacillus sp. AFS017336]PEL11417.1 hypothetical protein CN601_11815 [Bacillus sp. AFS017336]
MTEPTLDDILLKLKLIISNELSRGEVADWASQYVMANEPIVENDIVWEFLQIVSGIDILDSPATYLHSIRDIEFWITQISMKK